MRVRLALELLEPRDVPSGGPWSVTSEAAADFSRPCLPPHVLTAEGRLNGSPLTAGPVAGDTPVGQLISGRPAVPGVSRWDWLANTVWYVPAENLPAYLAGPGLNNPVPVADQTVWHITSAQNGNIAGEATAQLSLAAPMHFTFQGLVTPQGHIRIIFTPTDSTLPPTTGIGQMRLVEGAWRMEMQMASGTGPLVIHWAYMTQLSPGEKPPAAVNLTAAGGLRSEDWGWLRGTRWALSDTALFGTGRSGGVFQIDGFQNGYFWGTGRGTAPFTVLGAVTPEGNVFLVISVEGAPAVTRAGLLRETGQGWVMALWSDEGAPAVGRARLLT